MIEDYANIRRLANTDVDVLISKGKSYGSSWRSRGGVGAFMMLARKWDRIEKQVSADNYDIFKTVITELGDPAGILDDIQDLRRYLLLVESHLTAPKVGPSDWRHDDMAPKGSPELDTASRGMGYVGAATACGTLESRGERVLTGEGNGSSKVEVDSFESYNAGIAVGQAAEEVSHRLAEKDAKKEAGDTFHGLNMDVARKIAEDREDPRHALKYDTEPPIIPAE